MFLSFLLREWACAIGRWSQIGFSDIQDQMHKTIDTPVIIYKQGHQIKQ
jgi:hypothetical protein